MFTMKLPSNQENSKLRTKPKQLHYVNIFLSRVAVISSKSKMFMTIKKYKQFN